MALRVVDVRDVKQKGWRRINVSRRPHFRDDLHARVAFGNVFGRGYKREQYEEWVLKNSREQLIKLGQDGRQQDIELACWCHSKPRCHAHIVLELAQRLTEG